MLFDDNTIARFWAKVSKHGPLWNDTPCWPWQGSIASTGYGVFAPPKRQYGYNKLAHRVAYQLLVGLIPEQLTLDHLCRVRSCVNPAHLEPVSVKVNVLRGIGFTAQLAKRTHCPKGHAYDLWNTYIDKRGFRSCKQCQTQRSIAWKQKKRASLELSS